jgi:hypothetical protein
VGSLATPISITTNLRLIRQSLGVTPAKEELQIMSGHWMKLLV